MKDVIACIDGTAVSAAVSDCAAWAARSLSAPLLLLHVLDKSEYPTETNLTGNIGLGSREALMEELASLDEKRGRLALEQGRLMLEAARERVVAAGVPDPAVRQRHGSLIDTLVELEEEIRLLVMGKHDENLGSHVGSRLENVVRTMRRPILISPPEFTAPTSVLLAYDGSATTRKGVDMIAGSPLFRGLPCHVVMVAPDTRENRGQLEWARHTLEASEFEVSTALLQGEVEASLCGYRREHGIDMVMMGAYGHSVIRRFLVGSTTTGMIRNAMVPVLLLR